MEIILYRCWLGGHHEQAASQEGPQFIVLNERGQTLTEAARRMNLTCPVCPDGFMPTLYC